MANATFGNGVGDFTDTIVAQRGFYGQHFFWGFNFMLGFSAQCVGFGIVGLMRKYLVEPASMIWPQTLVSASFIRQALERVRICYIITWIRPKNVVINQLFGGWTGISLIPITLDVGLFGDRLHVALADFKSCCLLATIPINSICHVLRPRICLYRCGFVHVLLFHDEEIWIRAKAAERSLDNNHMKMMRKYKAVPDWWYGVLLIVMIAFSFATCLAWPTNLSRWALIIALLISFVWTILIGIVYATTNIHLGLNVCTKYIIGYMQPGRPLAMMLFKTYGCITINQAHFFLQDLKLGLYLKVPQRVTFFAQVVGTLWSCVIQLGTLECALNHIKGICKSGQADNFTCHGPRVFFNASVIFGLIGPQRIFSTGSIYSSLQYFWLAGALVPSPSTSSPATFRAPKPASSARPFSLAVWASSLQQHHSPIFPGPS
ncbi:OPT oligopeptide transporter protein-domain-containing protein [Hyaloscypha finlandica]|nr:OPT oligopeptide transporter protein-domain-containing protein [Hyaloscypha finlandica]